MKKPTYLFLFIFLFLSLPIVFSMEVFPGQTKKVQVNSNLWYEIKFPADVPGNLTFNFTIYYKPEVETETQTEYIVITRQNETLHQKYQNLTNLTEKLNQTLQNKSLKIKNVTQVIHTLEEKIGKKDLEIYQLNKSRSQVVKQWRREINKTKELKSKIKNMKEKFTHLWVSIISLLFIMGIGGLTVYWDKIKNSLKTWEMKRFIKRELKE